MAKATVLRLRRGTSADHTTFIGAQSEVTHNTTTGRLHLHDGTIAGGIPLARLDEIPSGGGTVTSVGLTVPTGLTVANSPVTVSGTIAVTYASGYQGFTATEATKLAGIADGATANSPNATLLARANHTGTQAISTITNLQTTLDGKAGTATATGSVNGLMSSTDKQKLDSITVSDLMLLGGTLDYGTIV
ncbi:hypothetical protein [Ochrobactrum sp. S1502_03]|uniref:hyaluronate lyase N-terminal domain-containing protein n=1 Tax=Ochrobactrum sp. S1502_03 TaxID=3108451 RepID=UPI0037CC21B2